MQVQKEKKKKEGGEEESLLPSTPHWGLVGSLLTVLLDWNSCNTQDSPDLFAGLSTPTEYECPGQSLCPTHFESWHLGQYLPHSG